MFFKNKNVKMLNNKENVKENLPTNHGFLALFSTVRPRKYSSNPFTGFACGCTDRVPSTYK